MVTHNSDAAAATDRVVRMHDGRIRYDGPVMRPRAVVRR
jgi:putative ABC transport system ATP-binding protein